MKSQSVELRSSIVDFQYENWHRSLRLHQGKGQSFVINWHTNLLPHLLRHCAYVSLFTLTGLPKPWYISLWLLKSAERFNLARWTCVARCGGCDIMRTLDSFFLWTCFSWLHWTALKEFLPLTKRLEKPRQEVSLDLCLGQNSVLRMLRWLLWYPRTSAQLWESRENEGHLQRAKCFGDISTPLHQNWLKESEAHISQDAHR